ncbi:unnamed protein product [Linum tenue]|uniref:N-acetyltransferase domain-containing protein n=1 Tax=Linum tenue TaxID=586396 RepID=A0AAV0HQE9_9ROSI|nr:unnamed protein product [Linum tenue]
MVKPTVLKSVVGTLDLIPVAGVKLMYVHVDRNNKPALQLFEKMGFEASDGLVEDNTYLLRCSL